MAAPSEAEASASEATGPAAAVPVEEPSPSAATPIQLPEEQEPDPPFSPEPPPNDDAPLEQVGSPIGLAADRVGAIAGPAHSEFAEPGEVQAEQFASELRQDEPAAPIDAAEPEPAPEDTFPQAELTADVPEQVVEAREVAEQEVESGTALPPSEPFPAETFLSEPEPTKFTTAHDAEPPYVTAPIAEPGPEPAADDEPPAAHAIPEATPASEAAIESGAQEPPAPSYSTVAAAAPLFGDPGPSLAIPKPRAAASQTSPSGARSFAAKAGRYLLIGLGCWFAAMLLLIALFRFVDPPGSALMLIRAVQGAGVDQRWVPLEEISPNLVRAVIVSEDGRFCTHWGIDPIEIVDALRRSNGSTPRGASTMTMQLAKNLFLWPNQDYVRKALEVPLTLAIDALWPKDRIAEVYLNIVEWGPGIFGAEAAARRHFNRTAAKLTPRQAALLAVTLPNPIRRKPAAPSRLLSRMATTIEARVRSAPTADDCVTRARQ